MSSPRGKKFDNVVIHCPKILNQVSEMDLVILTPHGASSHRQQRANHGILLAILRISNERSQIECRSIFGKLGPNYSMQKWEISRLLSVVAFIREYRALKVPLPWASFHFAFCPLR